MSRHGYSFWTYSSILQISTFIAVALLKISKMSKQHCLLNMPESLLAIAKTNHSYQCQSFLKLLN